MLSVLLLFYSATFIALSKDPTTLEKIYWVDTTLSIENSPYSITSNTLIRKEATLTIENGVELVFLNDSILNIDGSVIVGCNSINSSLYHNNNMGLFDNQSFTHIHGQSNNSKIIFCKGCNSLYSKFCNTLFDRITFDNRNNPASLLFNSCEFNTYGHNTIRSSGKGSVIISDSWFHVGSGLSAVGDGEFIINNCLIEDLMYFWYASNAFVYNTYIINICIGMHWSTVNIENSTISNCITGIDVATGPRCDVNIISTKITNCSTGIDTIARTTITSSEILNCSVGVKSKQTLSIKFSNISNNGYGVKLLTWGQYIVTIQYNNFENNIINIENGDHDQVNLNYNYFGTDITNQSIIAAKIKDICSGYSNGLITFWPWLTKPYINMDSVSEIYTFDFMGCNSIKTAESYNIGKTLSPTIPTESPTKWPSHFPIISPTVIPTTSPTISASMVTESPSLKQISQQITVKDDSSKLVIILTITIILLIIIILIGVIYMYSKREEFNKMATKVQIESETKAFIEPKAISETQTEGW
eukprot:174414_1